MHFAKSVSVLISAMALAGCTQSVARLSPDFGRAVREDAVAQLADPDAHYAGKPDPGTDASRVELAQKRYTTGTVIQPSSITASSGASVGNADNGSQPGVSGPTAGGGAATPSP